MDYLELDEQRDQIDREVIKCVVVGDSGVGKTRLICAEALGIRTTFSHLNQNSHHLVHFPSVFAIDRYHASREIRERANFTVDGVNVALRLWDTFGDHEMNRKFAYQNADVAVICFSINLPTSFRNVNAVWYPDLKRYCPRTPIILAGTRSDLRCQVASNAALKRSVSTSLSTRIRECTLVAPDMGRQVAREIGATYYECSAVNTWGVKDVFENAVRAALISRRSTRFWSSHLKKVSRPLIQAPYLPEKPIAPVVDCPPSAYREKLQTALESTVCADVVFLVQGESIKAHRAVLVTASPVFAKLFGIESLANEYKDQGCFLAFLPKKQCYNEITVQDAIVSGKSGKLPRGFLSLEQISDKIGSTGKDCKVYVTVDNSISGKSFRSILGFLYTGNLEMEECSVEFLHDARYLQILPIITGYFENILHDDHDDDDDDDAYIHEEVFSEMDKRMMTCAHKLVNSKSLSDVVFVIEGRNIPAHKVFLLSQCEMFSAMFTEGHFKESGWLVVELKDVDYGSFVSVLEYLYTGQCLGLSMDEALGVMALANFFCLPQLIAICESNVVSSLQMTMAVDELAVASDVILCLKEAQMHNARQLEAWCLHYITIHYNDVCRKHSKDVKMLDTPTRDYLEQHRWPPAWYLVEADWYERMKREKENEMEKNRKGCKHRQTKPLTERHKRKCSCLR